MKNSTTKKEKPINNPAPLFTASRTPSGQLKEWRSSKKKILMIISDDNWLHAAHFAQSIRDRGYQILGYLHNDQTKESQKFGLKSSGSIQDLPKILESQPVDAICITVASLRQEKIKKAIKVADYYGVRVNLVPENLRYLKSNFKFSTVGGLPAVPLRNVPLDNKLNAIIKKVFDFVFALTAIVILFPIFLLIALLIYLDRNGPIIYAPIRKGEARGTFRCYKFRTMSDCDNPLNGTKSTEKNDPRITHLGKYLRKFDLDELPQFFNVLKGEMSIVGPRPHRPFLAQDFRKIVNDYMVRHYVKPGITGWAQVNGWRGPTETVEQKQERVNHDLWYIENWNFLLDIKIIFLTVVGKKTRKNAF
ncbi:MAG: exopolysaccharide biosynthesis polyprenyl glycosylphosphotransferase [Cyclobacteriaceae bacterium]